MIPGEATEVLSVSDIEVTDLTVVVCFCPLDGAVLLLRMVVFPGQASQVLRHCTLILVSPHLGLKMSHKSDKSTQSERAATILVVLIVAVVPFEFGSLQRPQYLRQRADFSGPVQESA